MKPAPFDYLRPRSLDEVVHALVEHPGARVLAGGQSLLPAMARRALRPPLLVDLRAVPGLDQIDRTAHATLLLGARVTQRQVEHDPLVGQECPLLTEAVRRVGHPQIRTRGTVVGGMVQADPAGELPAVLVALDGVVHARGPRGTRRIDAADFYPGAGRTALHADEVAVAVELPLSPGVPLSPDDGAMTVGAACVEVAPRANAALCGVLAQVGVRADGTVTAAWIALFGVADRPVRARRVEQSVLDGARPGTGDDPGGIDGYPGIEGYPGEVVGALVDRALRRAVGRAHRRRLDSSPGSSGRSGRSGGQPGGGSGE